MMGEKQNSELDGMAFCDLPVNRNNRRCREYNEIKNRAIKDAKASFKQFRKELKKNIKTGS